MDGIWSGSGQLRDGIIENCGAQFCDDNDESLEIYEMIEEAIAAGKSSLKVEMSDDTTRTLTWIITPGDDAKTITIEYSLDSLGDITPMAFQTACEAVAKNKGYQVEFRVGLHNRETIDGEPVDLIVESAFMECCR